MWKESVPVGRRKLFHQRIDFACGDRHDDPLDGADFCFGYLLFPGDAKVVFDSRLTLPGDRCRQSNDRRGAGVELIIVTNGVVEVAVGFMLLGI